MSNKLPVGLKDFKIEMVPIDKLIPFVNNPKAHPESQIDKIAKSIREFGPVKNIVINGDNVILCGHGSILAYKKLGVGVAPCYRALNLTEAQQAALRIADNRTAESSWLPEFLAAELKALEEMDFDLGLTGFDKDEIENMLGFEVGETAPPALADGDRSPFQQMTFTLHDNQVEEIKAAMNKAKAAGGGESAVNENSNGNALAFICQEYNRG